MGFMRPKAQAAPPPVDPGESMGEYLFGQGFKNYQGVTDPELQERLISAEETYRPRYAALELQDIATAARGIGDPTQTAEYRALQSELDSLRSIEGGVSDEQAMQIAKSAAGRPPSEYKTVIGKKSSYGRGGSSRSKVRNKNYEKEKRDYDNKVKEISTSLSGNREARISSIESQLSSLSAQGGTPGLFDLLEEQSQRAGKLQRSESEKQRAADVGALQEYAPQVVEAYRQADPYSTKLADLAQQQAETLYAEGEGELSPERRRAAEQAARETAMQQGRIGDQSLMASELLGRERFRSGLRQEARQAGAQAFGMQRGMAGDVGMTLLGRPTQSIGLGGQVLGQSQGLAAGPMGPQLFDPNVGINMALQQRGQNMSLMGVNQQAKAAHSAGIMSAIGQIGGSYAGTFG